MTIASIAIQRGSEGFSTSGFPLLEFNRKPIDPDSLVGFVLAKNARLTLVQPLDTDSFRLNGYAIFRNSDVKGYRPIAKNAFLARAARLQKLRPSRPRAVRIGSLSEALSSAGSGFPLITIHRERLNKRVCYVGKFLSASQRAVAIRPISPQAEWEGEERYSLRDITLLEFGGEYERLLYQIARK